MAPEIYRPKYFKNLIVALSFNTLSFNNWLILLFEGKKRCWFVLKMFKILCSICLQTSKSWRHHKHYVIPRSFNFDCQILVQIMTEISNSLALLWRLGTRSIFIARSIFFLIKIKIKWVHSEEENLQKNKNTEAYQNFTSS